MLIVEYEIQALTRALPFLIACLAMNPASAQRASVKPYELP